MGVRISDLPTANTIADTDYLEAEVSGDSRKVTPPTILDGSGYFSTTTGHNHDGVNSKKIDKENVVGLTSSDSPTFSTVKLTNLSDGYIPYHSSDTVGLVDGILKTNVDAAYTHTSKTDNPHSVTKAQVGLGSVTDDAQLKRAANDINSFTLKGSPVSTDVVLIEDSADSYNKKKATVLSLGGTNYEAENGFETIAYGSIDADTLDGLHASAFILHSLATAANDFLVASGAGAFVKKTLSEVQSLITSILSMDAIYDRGSEVNVDNTDVKYKLSTGKQYKFTNSNESETYFKVDGNGSVISRLSNDVENGFEIISYT